MVGGRVISVHPIDAARALLTAVREHGARHGFAGGGVGIVAALTMAGITEEEDRALLGVMSELPYASRVAISSGERGARGERRL